MNRDLTQRSRTTIGVPLCSEDTAGTGSRCCVLLGSAHEQVAGRPFI
ncbi:unnamed protein product, partial [Staurois parvus]